jgi:hypothetical protein
MGVVILSSQKEPKDEIKDEMKEETPRVKEKDVKFSYFEPIAGILFAVVATVIFLGFPQIIAVVFVSGPLIPTFNADVIRSLWIPIILWALFRIAIEAFYFYEHRYTKRLAIVTMTGNVLALICTLVIFIPFRIVNPEYVDWIHTYFSSIGSEWFGEILARPNLVIIAIMLIGLILDSITVSIKGFKKKKEDEEEEEKEDGVTKGSAVDASTDKAEVVSDITAE